MEEDEGGRPAKLVAGGGAGFGGEGKEGGGDAVGDHVEGGEGDAALEETVGGPLGGGHEVFGHPGGGEGGLGAGDRKVGEVAMLGRGEDEQVVGGEEGRAEIYRHPDRQVGRPRYYVVGVDSVYALEG